MTATGTGRCIAAAALLAFLFTSGTAQAKKDEPQKIGVIFTVHGGFDTYNPQYLFDNTVQQFGYDPNNIVYKMFIWNPTYWNQILWSPDSLWQVKKYEWEYARLGGYDGFHAIVAQQTADLQKFLHHIGKRNNVTFEVDSAGWMAAGDFLPMYAYPRFLYNGPTPTSAKLTYCGEKEPGRNGQPWDGCNPQRFNIDGPFERLAKKGVERIFLVDLTVGGVRFNKTFDVYKMGMRALADYATSTGGTPIPVSWVNDPNDLMLRSYPTAPAGWTASLGVPAADPSVPLEGNPNPITEDPIMAQVNATAIAKAFNPAVSPAKTGVVLMNHSISAYNEFFDPKINDTMKLNDAIKAELLRKFPEMNPANIVGGFTGHRLYNPANRQSERTREMRGENNGDNYMYEQLATEPPPPWGYRYWAALDLLRTQGVEHIVVGFPQISADSVLNLVEIPNQIGKEVGYKAWLPIRHELDWFTTYPDPFAEYWGIWGSTMCGAVPCCFTMGGCSDGRPYPAPRQTAPTKAMAATDPSLVYDMAEYGHLGYDPALGAPNPAQPVQAQYRGTWSMYRPPNNDPALIHLMARQVEKAMWNVGIGKARPCGHDDEVGFALE